METIHTQIIPMRDVVENTGQIDGVTANPRKISTANLKKLVQSIKDYPEMLSLRELLVYPHNGKFVVIGGNMRYRAMKHLGFQEAPAKVISEDATPEQLNAYIYRDNSHFGEWDFTNINFDRNDFNMAGVGIELKAVPNIDLPAEPQPVHASMNCRQKTEGGKFREPKTTLKYKPQLHRHGDSFFFSSFTTEAEGLPISKIKSDEFLDIFTDAAENASRGLLQLRNVSGWCLVSPPQEGTRTAQILRSRCAVRCQPVSAYPFTRDLPWRRTTTGCTLSLTRYSTLRSRM